MECLIKDAIEILQSKKKRPAMEDIFNIAVRQGEAVTIEEFKEVFEDCLKRGIIEQRGEKDSYFFKDSVQIGTSVILEESASVENINTNINENVNVISNDRINPTDKCDSVGEDRDLIDMIKGYMFQEKVRADDYIKELKDDIKFLRNQILRKDDIIFKLLEKFEENSQVETIPNRCKDQDPIIHNVNDITSINSTYNDDNAHGNTNELPDKNNHNVKRDKRNARNNKVEIIGDSMLNGLIDDKLSKHNTIKTVKHPGWTSNDLKHEVMKTIENKPNLIIFHVGTNDITNNVDTIANYQAVINKIIKKSPQSNMAISSVIKRLDRKNIDKKVITLNEKLKKLCEENHIDYINNDNVDESCLGERKLHLGTKGNAYLASNFIKYVKSRPMT